MGHFYYHRLYAKSKPSLHNNALSVVLDDNIFSESTMAGKGSVKQGESSWPKDEGRSYNQGHELT
jgi:hypothetical protein